MNAVLRFLASVLERTGDYRVLRRLDSNPGFREGTPPNSFIGIALDTETTGLIPGRQVAERAAQTLKRINLELGGKTPLVVFEDADIDTVAPLAVTALTKFNGEF